MQANLKSSRPGGLIALLGLVALVAGLIIMLLLPEISLAAWGIMGAGILLLLLAVVIDFRRVRGAVTGHRGRFGLGTGIMSFIFIGIIIVVNALSIGHYHRFDTSSLSQYTLTPQTTGVLKNLAVPVKVINFFDPNDRYGVDNYLTSLLAEYSAQTRQLSVQRIDADTHPDQARKYGITEYQTIVFESEGRHLLVPPYQFIVSDQEGNVTGVEAEHAFTSAILQVIGVAQKKVYFLTGHGEASIDANFSKAGEGLLDDLYLVDTLNLITHPGIPGDCTALIIAAPENALSGTEIDTINNYLGNGGQALILVNPGLRPDIEKIISPLGVNLGDGTIIDPASSVAPHQDMPVVPKSRNYFYLPDVYFPGATAIIPQKTIPGNVQIYPLVYTSGSSWLDKNFTTDKQPVFDPDTEKMESLAIGVLIAAAPTTGPANKLTRLVVLGDSDFASNEHFDNANNGDLFLNSVSWLAEETSLISIRRNVQPFRRLVVTLSQSNFITYSSVSLLPVLLLVAAGIIWWRRR
jgi:hypothetical protein